MGSTIATSNTSANSFASSLSPNYQTAASKAAAQAAASSSQTSDTQSTNLTSGAIRFSGLGSGTDFDSMITKLVEKEKTRSKQLQNWRAEWSSKSKAFDQLNAAMLSLKSTLEAIDTPDKFLLKQATSSNAQVLTATATSGAEESAHQVEVYSLAKNDMHMGRAIFASPDDVVSGGASGTFAFTYGNRQISVDVTSTTTLTQFASLINSDPDNQGSVRASVINDGSGYRLQIRGMNLGAGNDFIVDDAQTSAGLLPSFGSGQFIETQNASNAMLTVDGWPTAGTPPTRDIVRASVTGKAATDVVSASGGQFKFTYAGALHTVNVSATDTFATLADNINAAVGFSMAEATTNADGNAELTLIGDPGSDNQIVIINSPGTTIPELQSRNFAQIQGATQGFIERSSNTISDLIPGINMNLTSTGSTTLSASLNSDAVVQNVQIVVEEINYVLGLIQEQTKVTTVGKNTRGSLLTGNYGLQMIQQNIKNILAKKGEGFDYDLDALVSLGSVGITTDSTQGSPTFGLLQFDAKAFAAALTRDPNAVARLFSADEAVSAKEVVGGVAVESTNFKFDSRIKGVTEAGEFALSYTVDASGTIVSAMINGEAANISGNKIVAMGGQNPARGLAIEVINLTPGSYSGSVQIKAGKTTELAQELKKLTDKQTGTLNILKDNYQDIMDAIDDKLAYEEKRLTLMEKTLRNRFAELEAVLGRYDKISSQLSSQINSLPKK